MNLMTLLSAQIRSFLRGINELFEGISYSTIKEDKTNVYVKENI